MTQNINITIIIAFFILPSLCKAMDPGRSRPITSFERFYNQSDKIFYNNDSIVRIPAKTSEYIFTAIGYPVVAVFAGPFVIGDDTPISFLKVAYFSNISFGLLGKGIMGIPLFITKSLLWDMPNWAITSLFKDKEEKNSNEVVSPNSDSAVAKPE
jgi:hypothetical protein